MAFLACLTVSLCVGDNHALGNGSGTGCLQLGHPGNFDETHPAGALEGEAGIVAERRYFNTKTFAGFDQQGSPCLI